MNLIDLSIRRPVFAWVIMFALIVFGAICMNRMGISQLPDVDFPIVSVSVTYEGAAPEVVEAELVDPIEERLLAIEGIKEMRSSARQGTGVVTLEFDINRNVDVVLQEVQTALSQLRLPQGVDPAVVRKQNPEEDPIMIVSIYGDASLKDMLNWTNNYLLDQLRFLPGIGEVSIGGFSERNLRIWLDVDKLAKNYLTVNDVVAALASQHLESAAGQFTEKDRELRVRWLGEATNTKEVGDIQILNRGGQRIQEDRAIYIRDVARVEDGLSDVRRIARFEGRQAVAMQVRKQRGTNEVQVADAVHKKLAEIKDSFPKGYNYRINVDYTRSTEATVHLTLEKLWVAALITIVICFLFLGSIPAAINILFSIPTSIVGTFTILYFSGFTLNLFTLLALTLSISIVVDDAIMLLENIIRHYRMGKGSAKAASDGSKEVLPAAIAATLAVVAVFLPVVFMDGIIGKFFFQFGITMSAAVLLSLLEAVTITPMRAAAFLSSEPKVSKLEHYLDVVFENFSHAYQKVLKITLNWKYAVVIASLIFFTISMFLVTKVRQEFVPAQDQNFIVINAQAAPGTSLQATSDMAKQMEDILHQNPNIEGFVTSIGGGGGSSNVNQAFIPVTLKPRAEREQNHVQIMNDLRQKFKAVKGMRISMRDVSARNLSSGRQNPLAINLRGSDLDILQKKSQELIERLEKEKLAVDLDSDFRSGIPELILKPDRKAMADRGVSIETVGELLQAGIGGLRQGRYTADGRRYDVRFKINEDQVQKESDFKRLYVRNNFGNLIPLSQLVKIEESGAIQSISRVNRQRAISVFGNLYPGQSQSAVLQRTAEIAKEILPPGYSYALEGASAGFAQSFQSLYSALAVGILVAYLILAVQFNSFIHPIAVLVALPFSVSGALMALWIFDVSLNLFSFIGLIVLMGIAKKNSILLVEFTNQVRKHNKESIMSAILEACPVRLRPILMTSVATIAAAAPLIVGTGIGSETRLPMGLAIVGGTIVSTILTLFVVPALYLMLTPLERTKEVKL
ncbi:efflux RND transporter permease subunit [Bdellovibrio sp. SKB1291214]|uniref:efflux RND transporter permease subunit n=1 Tax=Bdellovibrio sp. SKB1291214 TaxID=1732569 RepID=UPI002240817F|nr:efflux RND transporter permease subunit [Bdellovibrio sp. SKB1291214]UYL10230.1 efflux RND transporter permease subunit [Bdellovibrio sp. SKB1291214]